MLNLHTCAYLSNHSYWNKAHEIPDPVATPQKYSLNVSEEAAQIASSHQASISASKARLTYISSESDPWNKLVLSLTKTSQIGQSHPSLQQFSVSFTLSSVSLD